MSIRNLRTLVLALGASLAAPAFAAGPYDGVYYTPGVSVGQYFSLHQNGSTIMAATFWTLPASNVQFSFGDGQSFPPSRLDVWDLFTGQISGNQVTVTGETQFGACTATYHVVFDSAGANVTRQGMGTTSLGISRGINCASYYSYVVSLVGTTFRATRVF